MKFILGCEGWRNNTKEIILRLKNKEYISFVLFPQASEPSMNLECCNITYLLESDVEFISKTYPAWGKIH